MLREAPHRWLLNKEIEGDAFSRAQYARSWDHWDKGPWDQDHGTKDQGRWDQGQGPWDQDQGPGPRTATRGHFLDQLVLVL